MSPLFQARLLLPLLETIRAHLGAGESASLKATSAGSPCIEARTERGSVIATINVDGQYMFDTAGGLYACDPNAPKESIYNTIRRALNDAREEWA
jgi:hypothetical protein